MPISVVFDPPLPSDSPSTFNTKAFTLLGDLNDWSTQANALPGEVATNLTTLLASPPAIGSTTPAAGSFTTLSASGTVSITKAAGVAKAVLTSATGTNEAYYQLVNGGGVYYFGIENNAGSWFGATPYAGVVQAPAGRVVQTVISATPITTVSSSGLAVTGMLSSGNGTIQTAISYDTGGIIGTLSNHILKFFTNSTAKMTLDTSGNLGIGVTPSAWTSGKAIEVGSVGNSFVGFSSTENYVSSNTYFNSGVFKYAANGVATSYGQVNGEHRWKTASSGTAGNPISFTQAMTLDASGKLTLAGNQLNFNNAGSTIEFVNRDTAGSKTFQWYYAPSGGGVPATLTTSGVWTNASDARGKENISAIHYGLSAVMALQPRQYDVKSDGSHAIGFVAQEVLPVIPEVVHGSETESYSLDYGSIAAVLVKAIQEQQALIESLTARVAQLEG